MRTQADTAVSLLNLALKAKRIDQDTFEFPSESKEGVFWYANIKSNICRDLEGRGCPSLYYRGVCKHLRASQLITSLLRSWTSDL